jgi:hypothetical protein
VSSKRSTYKTGVLFGVMNVPHPPLASWMLSFAIRNGTFALTLCCVWWCIVDVGADCPCAW